MAGNAPEHRVARLHGFRGQHLQAAAPAGTLASTHFDEMPLPWQIGLGSVAAMRALFEGQAGFFLPRVPAPPLASRLGCGELVRHRAFARCAEADGLVDLDRRNGE
jgi:NTE family protein